MVEGSPAGGGRGLRCFAEERIVWGRSGGRGFEGRPIGRGWRVGLGPRFFGGGPQEREWFWGFGGTKGFGELTVPGACDKNRNPTPNRNPNFFVTEASIRLPPESLSRVDFLGSIAGLKTNVK